MKRPEAHCTKALVGVRLSRETMVCIEKTAMDTHGGSETEVTVTSKFNTHKQREQRNRKEKSDQREGDIQ